MSKPSQPSTAHSSGWYVVAVLALTTFLSQLDRNVTSLIVGPLKAQFGISDTQFSLLQGYAFALSYALFGIPFGRLVDRANRRNLLAIGILVWSTLTVLAAFARSFSELVAARVGVGIGESVLAPAAFSIIADYFEPARRGRAIGIYYTSLTIGIGSSLLLGSALLRSIPASGLAAPVLGTLEPWQALFVFAGLPGFLAALALLSVREPPRRDVEAKSGVSLGTFFRYIGQHRAAFFPIFATHAFVTSVGAGVMAWAPALFDRRFHIPPSESGLIIGLLLVLTGLAGGPLSGWLSDTWASGRAQGGRVRVLFVGVRLLVICSVWPIMPTPWLCFFVLCATLFAASLVQASTPIALQAIVPNEMRGQVIALYLLITGVTGLGLGPTLVALMTERVFHSPGMLGWSLTCVAAPVMALATLACRRGLEPYWRLHLQRRLNPARTGIKGVTDLVAG